jgi:four helix bundle protein
VKGEGQMALNNIHSLLKGVAMSNFKKLMVWLRSKDLAVLLYKITEQGKIQRDFGLKDQIRRAAVSIPSNIAEGDELSSDKQSVRYFYIAKGSAAELYTQLTIANEIGYIDDENFKKLIEECIIISSMLSKLISARSN